MTTEQIHKIYKVVFYGNLPNVKEKVISYREHVLIGAPFSFIREYFI